MGFLYNEYKTKTTRAIRATSRNTKRVAPDEVFFEIVVDSEPRCERGQYRNNFVADCRKQRSQVVRVPEDHYVSCRQDGDKFIILAIAAPEWLLRSHQEVVRQAAAETFANLTAQLLK